MRSTRPRYQLLPDLLFSRKLDQQNANYRIKPFLMTIGMLQLLNAIQEYNHWQSQFIDINEQLEAYRTYESYCNDSSSAAHMRSRLRVSAYRFNSANTCDVIVGLSIKHYSVNAIVRSARDIAILEDMVNLLNIKINQPLFARESGILGWFGVVRPVCSPKVLHARCRQLSQAIAIEKQRIRVVAVNACKKLLEEVSVCLQKKTDLFETKNELVSQNKAYEFAKLWRTLPVNNPFRQRIIQTLKAKQLSSTLLERDPSRWSLLKDTTLLRQSIIVRFCALSSCRPKDKSIDIERLIIMQKNLERDIAHIQSQQNRYKRFWYWRTRKDCQHYLDAAAKVRQQFISQRVHLILLRWAKNEINGSELSLLVDLPEQLNLALQQLLRSRDQHFKTPEELRFVLKSIAVVARLPSKNVNLYIEQYALHMILPDMQENIQQYSKLTVDPWYLTLSKLQAKAFVKWKQNLRRQHLELFTNLTKMLRRGVYVKLLEQLTSWWQSNKVFRNDAAQSVHNFVQAFIEHVIVLTKLGLQVSSNDVTVNLNPLEDLCQVLQEMIARCSGVLKEKFNQAVLLIDSRSILLCMFKQTQIKIHHLLLVVHQSDQFNSSMQELLSPLLLCYLEHNLFSAHQKKILLKKLNICLQRCVCLSVRQVIFNLQATLREIPQSTRHRNAMLLLRQFVKLRWNIPDEEKVSYPNVRFWQRKDQSAVPITIDNTIKKLIQIIASHQSKLRQLSDMTGMQAQWLINNIKILTSQLRQIMPQCQSILVYAKAEALLKDTDSSHNIVQAGGMSLDNYKRRVCAVFKAYSQSHQPLEAKLEQEIQDVIAQVEEAGTIIDVTYYVNQFNEALDKRTTSFFSPKHHLVKMLEVEIQPHLELLNVDQWRQQYDRLFDQCKNHQLQIALLKQQICELKAQQQKLRQQLSTQELPMPDLSHLPAMPQAEQKTERDTETSSTITISLKEYYNLLIQLNMVSSEALDDSSLDGMQPR